MYGDSYLPCDYSAIARNFESAGVLGMMMVFRNEGRWDTSNVEFEAGKILTYSKTNLNPRMRYIDYGLGVFRAEAFNDLPVGEASDLTSLYLDLLRRRQLAAYEVTERFYEIGSPQGLRETAEFLAAQRVNQV
jgi:NDP-sugar pyrophosphorylase family protein